MQGLHKGSREGRVLATGWAAGLLLLLLLCALGITGLREAQAQGQREGSRSVQVSGTFLFTTPYRDT